VELSFELQERRIQRFRDESAAEPVEMAAGVRQGNTTEGQP
jgi:hypothetical protein